jgi:hypothetical protein
VLYFSYPLTPMCFIFPIRGVVRNGAARARQVALVRAEWSRCRRVRQAARAGSTLQCLGGARFANPAEVAYVERTVSRLEDGGDAHA